VAVIPERGQSNDEAIFRSLVKSGPAGSLQTQIRNYIVECELRPGDRLPSEAELAAAQAVREGLTMREVDTDALREALVSAGAIVDFAGERAPVGATR